jgi:hypothetical protein
MAQPEPSLTVEQRLDLAKDLIEKGEEFYARAADQIIAARKADPQLGYREIANVVGHGISWCSDLVQWRTSVLDPERETPAPATPWAGTYEERLDRGTRRTLKDRPEIAADEIAEAVATNPIVRRKVEERLMPKTETLTDADEGRRRKDADAYAQEIGRPIRDTFHKMAVTLHLEQALEELQEMSSITDEQYEEIEAAIKEIAQEAEIKRAMAEVQ